jgi:hypothetical protein
MSDGVATEAINHTSKLSMHKLNIQTGQSLPTDSSYEIDPLEEFSSFERGLFTYCRDYNCEVHLAIGSQDVVIELFRDLKPHLTYLPQAISDSANSGRLIIDLPELGTLLRLEWTDTSCICMLDFVPTEVDRNEAVKSIASFLESLVSHATNARYIKQVEADDFLGTLQAALAKSLAT